MLNNIVFCDIDGTIVPTCFNSNQPINREELNKIKERVERLTLSRKILLTLQLITKNADLVFLTGRPKAWKDLTHKLLNPMTKKYKIYFHNVEEKWTTKGYYDFKLKIINNLAKNYDIIYVIDDTVDLLKYIKKYFKCDNKLLFLINGVFNPLIKDIVIKNRLM